MNLGDMGDVEKNNGLKKEKRIRENTMNNEAYEIRHEISRLKERLKEIDGDNLTAEEEAQMTASNVCGQDVALEHIQKLCKERGTKDIAIMAGWSQSNSWYSTTITPSYMKYLLRDVKTVINYIQPLMEENRLRIMQEISQVESISREALVLGLKLSEDDIDTLLEELAQGGFIRDEAGLLKLTVQGWHTFVALGHISYNYSLKLEISKAIPIAQAFMEVFDYIWGMPMEKELSEVMELLEKKNKLEWLYNQNVTDEDIAKAVYENKVSLID